MVIHKCMLKGIVWVKLVMLDFEVFEYFAGCNVDKYCKYLAVKHNHFKKSVIPQIVILLYKTLWSDVVFVLHEDKCQDISADLYHAHEIFEVLLIIPLLVLLEIFDPFHNNA